MEFVQSVITRMAGNSFLIKTRSITLITGLFALSAKDNSVSYFSLLPLLPALVFWGLDAYYLRQERLFRKLYDVARMEYLSANSKFDLFSMATTEYNKSVASWIKVAFSPTILGFHGTLTIVIIAINAGLRFLRP